MSEELKTWVGSSIEDIMCGITSATIQQAPNVENSANHTVLFQLPLPENLNEIPIPICEENDQWDDLHVRLPCSNKSTYREINEDGEEIIKLRWDLIKKSLSAPIKNSRDLEKAIKTYNSKYEKVWSFETLHELFEDEFNEDDNEYIFDDLLPAMISLALDMPILFKAPIPLLRQQSNHSISMSQQQAACILANAFFCTFPNRAKRNSDFPEINFSRLYRCEGMKVINKLKCILNYFRVILLDKMPTGVITFQRRCIEEFPDWSSCEDKLSSIKWHINSKGTIEEGYNMLQVDFANRFLGGGVLGSGCVQEEIRFMISPECMVGMLFCECMKQNEAIYIYGTEQFSDYKGYASTFVWSGNHKDRSLERDKYRRKLEHIVAIDALSFYKPKMQFKEFALKREINKAYCGFYSTNDINIPVATGNWGCGAFCGYNRLKCLIQLIACVANKRNLVYFTFNDYELLLDMEEIFQFLQQNDVTVAQLWKYLKSFNPSNDFNLLYHHIHEQVLIDKEMAGLENCLDLDKNTEELFGERTVEGCSEKVVADENIQETASKNIETVIEIPLEDSLLQEETLENPTKRMKIDDETMNENEVPPESPLSFPPKNKLITDYFTKKTI